MARRCSASAPTTSCISAAKLFFAYGLGNGMTFPMSVGATTVLLPARPTPDAVFAVMARSGRRIFFGVPTLYAAMLADAAARRRKAATACGFASRPARRCPPRSASAGRTCIGVDILDGVGSTEMLHIFLSNAPGDIVYGTSGRAVPGYELRLVGEAGAEVADGEIGELLVSGPSAADGYWNQRDKSRAPSRANGRAPATNMCAARTGASSIAAAPTTCSRSAASGFRRSRWSRR